MFSRKLSYRKLLLKSPQKEAFNEWAIIGQRINFYLWFFSGIWTPFLWLLRIASEKLQLSMDLTMMLCVLMTTQTVLIKIYKWKKIKYDWARLRVNKFFFSCWLSCGGQLSFWPHLWSTFRSSTHACSHMLDLYKTCIE